MITQKIKDKLIKETTSFKYKEALEFVSKLNATNIRDDKKKYFNDDVADIDDRDYDEMVEVFSSLNEEDDEYTIEFNCGSNYLEMVFSTFEFSYNFTSDEYKNFNSGIIDDEVYGETLKKVSYDDNRKMLTKLVQIANVIDQ